MRSVLDQVADRGGHQLYKLAQQYAAEDLFRQASQESLSGDGDLPRTVFADDAGRRFPCHTKAATCLSWLHFLEQRDALPTPAATRIEGQLRKFAVYHNVTDRVAQLRAKHAEIHGDGLDQLPDTAFASVQSIDGQIERRYPLRNALEVKRAGSWLMEHRDAFDFSRRSEMADRILVRADQLGAGLGDDLEEALQKQAGRGWCLPQDASDLIAARLSRYGHKLSSEERTQWEKLAEYVAQDRSLILDNAKLCKLAGAIDALDRQVDAAKCGELPRIEDRLFATTHKEVRATKHELCRTQTGSLYNTEQFAKLSLDALRSALGNEVADAVSYGLDVDPEKCAMEAAAWPRPDARLLDELMQEIGQPPIAKEAQAAGPAPETWSKLAQLHNAPLTPLRR